MRYAFIKMHQKAWPITLMCRVLEVSKTGYYDWGKRCPGVRAASNQALDEHIREVACPLRTVPAIKLVFNLNWAHKEASHAKKTLQT